MKAITPDDLLHEQIGLSDLAICIINDTIRKTWDGKCSSFPQETLNYEFSKARLSVKEIVYTFNSFQKVYEQVGWTIKEEKIKGSCFLIVFYTFTKA